MAKDKDKEKKFNKDNYDSKEASLKAALAMIQKQLGADAVRKYSDGPLPNVESISSGSMGLDIALGVGGYAKGRIIEIYGPEASGKCLTADNYVWTREGLLTVAELFEAHGHQATCVSKQEPCKASLINRYGQVEDTSTFTWNGRRNVFTVTLRDGTTIKSTAKHPYLVMNSRGNWVWKNTQDLVRGDHICKVRGTKRAEEHNSAMYALGSLIADGCFVDNDRISFTNNDTTIVSEVVSFMASEGFTCLSYPRPENNTTEFHFNGKDLVAAFFAKYGLEHVRSGGKLISKTLRTSEGVYSLLKGYIECEGYFHDDKSTLEVSSASKGLLTQVQNLLQMYGIFARVYDKEANNGETYWHLEVSDPSYHTYVSKFYPHSKVRQEEVTLRAAGHSNNDVIPNIQELLRDLYDSSETTREHANILSDYFDRANPTYAKLEEILSLSWSPSTVLTRLQEIYNQQYIYVPVETVQLSGEEPTFDVEMPNTHSFVAGGIVTHNTTLTLHAIAECQKSGGTAAFIDAEHALDPKYAKALGVQMDDLIISQPDSGEKALEIAETLVSSGGVDLVVIDSVAALVPQAEIDGEMGDSHVGLQARLMSQALRKLTGVVSNSNTVLIFINQIRMKIGVMFGNPETTTGGNGLKFYASQRLEIRKDGGPIKEGEEAIGNRVRVKVVKNKVSPPFREAAFDIIYGKGINYFGELIDIGVLLNLVEKSGAWYSLAGERIGQGRDKSIAYLETHPDAVKFLSSNIRKHYQLGGADADEE